MPWTNYIATTLIMEGGLSSAQTDRARANPSPCGNGKNGYPYHTNKGVQWATFMALASKLGYVASCENFLKMPSAIWLKIYKYGFWDEMLGDKIKNVGIANLFSQWAWGSGPETATNSLKKFFKQKYGKDFTSINQIVDFVNQINDSDKNLPLFNALMAWRKEFLKNIPGDENDKGWFSREDKFYLLNLPYVLSNRTKKGLIYGTITITLGLTLIAYGKYRSR